MINSSIRDPPAVMMPSLRRSRDPNPELYGPRPMFKKHKVLPRPDKDRLRLSASLANGARPDGQMRKNHNLNLSIGTEPLADADLPPTRTPSHTLKHQPRRIPNGPDPPPTPPAHSRNSSSSHSVILPPSPTGVDTALEAEGNLPLPSPATPPSQKNLPTPDVTPPQSTLRPRAIRVLLSERTPSKSTSDSRSESFKTARETPYASEDEREKSFIQPTLRSARASQVTVRHVGPGDATPPEPQEEQRTPRQQRPRDEDSTPISKVRPLTFDGEWRMNSDRTEVVQEWDDNLQRLVKVRKRHPTLELERTPRLSSSPIDDILEDYPVTPTNATKAVRAMHLQNREEKNSPPSRVPVERATFNSVSTASPATTDIRRFSGVSARSSVSTVVEAVLVDKPPPQRRRTLRHVKKRTALRDSNPDMSPISSAPNSSAGLNDAPRGANSAGRPADARLSVSSINSISSSKARKEVWKQGAIPVVVVPDRQSSMKPAQPSLRSTSSRRSKRTASVTSTPLLNGSTGKLLSLTSEQPSHRGRPTSRNDDSDERTIDYPPVVPKRASSLSAPTSRNASRNASRTGSLTAESLKAHNALMEAQALKQELNRVESERKQERADETEKESEPEQQASLQPPEVALQPVGSLPVEDDNTSHKLSVDRYGDPLFGKRLSIQKTPFSMASMDTCGTAHEVSEALAVNIYPHQNSSVLMVDHGSSKKSQESDLSKGTTPDSPAGERKVSGEQGPRITTTGPDGGLPMTPPQPHVHQDDANYSPLRNPRAPPEPPAEPPAIALIPATPSGMTPAHERQNGMGNYFENEEPKPKRSVSLVRRALTRRYSESASTPMVRPRFLPRSLSLSRGVRKMTEPFSPDANKARSPPEPPAYPTREAPLPDEHMLHPFWRPVGYVSDSSEESSDEEDSSSDGDGEVYERVYRYPPVDNRPRRNFSQRLRKTFAVLPAREGEEPMFHESDDGMLDRRTIGRTASGNLRVVRRRASLESLGREMEAYDQRPYTAPESPDPTPFWRGYVRRNSVNRGGGGGGIAEVDGKPARRGILPMLSSKIEGLSSLPRRLSERKREKRSQELRRKISAPKEVRDGVGDVIRRRSYRGYYEQQAQE